MEYIKKRICQENFRSRFGGKIPTISLKDGKDVIYNDSSFSDYGSYPYDLRITNEDVYEGGSTLMEYIHKLFAIKENICEKENYISYENDSEITMNINDVTGEMETVYKNNEYVLKYKNMMHLKKILDDFVLNVTYYKLCMRDGKRIWVELTPEMWESNFSNGNNSLDIDGMSDSYKKFFFYDKMYIFEYVPFTTLFRLYEKTDTTEKNSNDYNILYYENKEDFPKYYGYYDLVDNRYATIPESIYLYQAKRDYIYFEVEEYDSEALDYVTKYYKTLYDTGTKLSVAMKTYEIEENDYGTDDYEEINNFVIGDILCVIDDFDAYKKFVMTFCNEFSVIEEEDYSGNFATNIPDEAKITNYFFDKLNGSFKYSGETSEKYVNLGNYKIIPKLDRERYEYYFYKLVNYLNKNKKTNDERVLTDVMPMLNLPIYIENEFDNLGIYTGDAETWEENKKYYVGDVVYYDGEYYTLKKYSSIGNYRRQGYGIEQYDITNFIKDFSIYNCEGVFSTNSGKKYFNIPYYKGYYDNKTRLTYFDKLDDDGEIKSDANGNFTHWQRAIVTSDEDKENDETILSAIGVSKLSIFVRTLDQDDNGETLPFKYIYDDDGYITENTELIYMLGPRNVTTDSDGNIYGDILDKILIRSVKKKSDLDNSPIQTLEYDKDKETVIRYDDIMDGGNVIEFVYYENCQLNPDTYKPIDDTGIKYIDRYTCAKKTYNSKIEKYSGTSAKWVAYDYDLDEYSDDDITYSSILPESMEFLNQVFCYNGTSNYNYVSGSTYIYYPTFNYLAIGEQDDDLLFSTFFTEGDVLMEFKSKVLIDKFVNTRCLKDEALLGVVDTLNTNDVYIDRGKSDAIERHQILSEVNTFEDLENYRNNFFNFKKNEESI